MEYFIKITFVNIKIAPFGHAQFSNLVNFCPIFEKKDPVESLRKHQNLKNQLSIPHFPLQFHWTWTINWIHIRRKIYIPLASRTTGFQCVITFDLSKTESVLLGKSAKFEWNFGTVLKPSFSSLFQFLSNTTCTHLFSLMCLIRWDNGPCQLQEFFLKEGQNTSRWGQNFSCSNKLL